MEDSNNFLKEIEEKNKAKAKPKLYKESSFKGSNKKVAPIPEEYAISASDSEEEKDVMMESSDKIGDLPMPQSMFAQPPKFSGRVKASIPTPDFPDAPKPKMKSLSRNYEPVSWEEVFDEREMIDDTIPLYHSGTTGPIIFCIHGAGHSALSFGPLSKACKDFARVVSFDLRGHGGHFSEDDDNMSVEILLQEAKYVLKYVINKFEDASVIICGHSLGGALAAKLAYSIIHPEEGNEPEFDAKHVTGLFVIDVAEGSAIGALPFMEQIVDSRPTGFDSVADAIKWGVLSGQVKSLSSAKITMPDLIIESDGKYKWRTDLLASKDYWKEWFVGMNKWFLDAKVPKTLVIASNDRMDTELTIAQMGGKFKLASMLDVGHTIQEDAPEELAAQFKDFINTFKIKTKYNERRVIIGANGREIIIDH